MGQMIIGSMVMRRAQWESSGAFVGTTQEWSRVEAALNRRQFCSENGEVRWGLNSQLDGTPLNFQNRDVDRASDHNALTSGTS